MVLREESVAGDELLHGLAQFLRRDGRRLHLLDLVQHGVARGGEFIRIHRGAQAEQAGLAGAVGPGIDAS